MCRKLGKGHKDYINRRDNMYAVDDKGVKRMRRMHNGVRVEKHHGANALNAYTDLRDKMWSWFPEQGKDYAFKASVTKIKQLKRRERSTNHGITRLNWAQKRSHLIRNNVCVVSYVHDNRS